jgi:DNA-binding transcriptional regulator LsrR (DeoR family)
MEKIAALSDEIVFAVCERFLAGEGATQIAGWLREDKKLAVNRETIYPILAEARRRNYLLLRAPEAHRVAQRLADRYDLALGALRVVPVRGLAALDHTAHAAAEVAAERIRHLGRRKSPVHVGLGAGWMTVAVARHLADRLRFEDGFPDLTLHALTSGFSVHTPQTAPVAFFSFFHDAKPHIDYVGLFAQAIVPSHDYERVKWDPGVSESFAAAGEIDLIITSLASAQDGHGDLAHFMQVVAEKKDVSVAAKLEELRQAGWIGDVQYRPYSATGPILIDTGVRAVTLFELSDLVRLAATAHKDVVLVAGPCGVCGATKASALAPLLAAPALRVWTRLVMDVATAEELLPATR